MNSKWNASVVKIKSSPEINAPRSNLKYCQKTGRLIQASQKQLQGDVSTNGRCNVLGCLEGKNDLHDCDSVYHHHCYSNFSPKKNPLKYQASVGWPKPEVLDDNYNKICQTMQDMEKNYEQITLLVLTRQMAELAVAKGRDA